MIVSQLSILGEREGEENTEQKGAGGRSPEERRGRRSRQTKWELLLHQSQGSGFPILHLEPARALYNIVKQLYLSQLTNKSKFQNIRLFYHHRIDKIHKIYFIKAYAPQMKGF